MKKLNFQIEVSKVLEILSNDIYDSPYALLRENIQNAYDAILMRISEEEGGSVFVTGFGFSGAVNLITQAPDQTIPLAMMLQGMASQMGQAMPQNAPVPQ